MVGEVADEGRDQRVRVGGAGEDVGVGEEESLARGSAVEEGEGEGGPRGGEKGFGSRVQPRGRERSGDLLHPPAGEDNEGHVERGDVLHGAGDVNDGEVGVEVVVARLERGVEARVDEVVEKGAGVEDDARGVETLRDDDGRLAFADGEELVGRIGGRGEQAAVPEESQGVLIALAKREARGGVSVIAFDLDGNVNEYDNDDAEKNEREEDGDNATHGSGDQCSVFSV